MTMHRSFESELLEPAETLVEAFARPYGRRAAEARFQLLEAVASRLGGFSLKEFHQAFGVRTIAPVDELLDNARSVVERLDVCGSPPALALSALAREKIAKSEQRTSGAYHTDFRLAQRLAELVSPKPTLRSRIVDPACGAGILLVALSMEVCGADRRKMAKWLADCVYAADRSPNALRGALLSLASLTSDISALARMRARWRVGDSLLDPLDWVPGAGFDVVIANPPWEKVKLSRHEFLQSNGHDRHYGAVTKGIDLQAFGREQAKVAGYSARLSESYPLLHQGEPDLYVAFTELFVRLTRPGGTVAALVPGGLIRSQGTEALRKHLFSISTRLSFSIIENRARFFGIDTRFKFLAMVCVKKGGRATSEAPLVLRHEQGTARGLRNFAEVKIGRRSLAHVRPDLSVPEVKTALEWRMFRQIAQSGEDWSNPASLWHPAFCREVDMTKERPRFVQRAGRGILPLIEGRMVQPHRFGAKEYIEGSGRRAVWNMLPFGESRVAPQFHIAEADVPKSSISRARTQRAGFCDITGQTNERSMMTALIPPGVICGNKVPTILFGNDPSEERLFVWCAIANSLPFDWIVRRVITTTLNYFLLLGLPLPRLVPNGLPWRRLADAAREMRSLDGSGRSSPANLRRAAELRASIDVEIAVAFGLKFEQLTAMLSDFPLLDRGQPALPGEDRSTITRDFLLLTAAKRMRRSTQALSARVKQAEQLGAIAYVPSESAEMASGKMESSHAG